jgi:uncharacterized protein (DUF58 family)
MSLTQAFQRQRQRFERRLARNGPQLRLTLRNLYILPSGFGGLWVMGTAVLYLLGINGSRNGPLLLAFLCSGLFLLSLFLTQFNLQGLELAVDQPAAGFAHDNLAYPIRLRSSCERHLLRVQFRGQPLLLQPLIPAGTSLIQPQWRAPQRGLQTPGLLKLYSKAPLGLFVCWSYWAPPEPQLIYPAPLAGPVIERWFAPQDAAQVLQGSIQDGGSDTFRELSPHRAEEGLQRVAWKQVARGHGWLAKRFEAEANSQRHLSPDPTVERERALQHLCARILELSRNDQPFALSIPGADPVAYGQGRSHRDAALRALALA